MGYSGGQDDPPAIENPRLTLALNHYTLLLLPLLGSKLYASGIQGKVKTAVLFSYPYVAFGVSTGLRIISISTMATAAAIANVMKASR